jgi:hypothetical protein
MAALHLKRTGCDITNIPKGAQAAALNSETRQREAKNHPSRQELSQGSSQCSQQPATDSYPQPHVSIPHLPIIFCKISFAHRPSDNYLQFISTLVSYLEFYAPHSLHPDVFPPTVNSVLIRLRHLQHPDITSSATTC